MNITTTEDDITFIVDTIWTSIAQYLSELDSFDANSESLLDGVEIVERNVVKVLNNSITIDALHTSLITLITLMSRAFDNIYCKIATNSYSIVEYDNSILGGFRLIADELDQRFMEHFDWYVPNYIADSITKRFKDIYFTP